MALETEYYRPEAHIPKKYRVDKGSDDTGAGSQAVMQALCRRLPRRTPKSLRRHGDGGIESAEGAAAASASPISRQDLREVSDALGRCVTSARHAQRLSAMAAKAFEDEAGIFEDVKEFVDAKVTLYTDKELAKDI